MLIQLSVFVEVSEAECEEAQARYQAGYWNDPGRAVYSYNYKSEPPGGYRGPVGIYRLPKDWKAMEAALGRVRLEADLDRAARDADFVIEAITERLAPKKECFARLDRAAPRHVVFATNSSTLGNSLLAPATSRPELCVNMHFFYPPLVMRLVEVVKGQWTSEAALHTTAELVRRIGREPVVLRKELPRR